MFFNRKAKAPDAVVNHEDAPAFRPRKALQLYATVVTSTLSDKFYESGAERIGRLRELIAANDPAFVARLAVYAREQMYLRSLPLVLAVELARRESGSDLVSRTVNRVVQRADEITELLAYYEQANGRGAGVKRLNGLSKQVQKGLALAFNKFDEYQFAKYDRDASIKLRDALFLTHPKAKDEAQQALFNKIAARKLATPYTWETELSVLGQQPFDGPEARQAAFAAKWTELIESGKLGYMALLRNLRNIIEAGVGPAAIATACRTLADPRQVAQARQLPFRFLAAYRELAGTTPQALAAQKQGKKLVPERSGYVPALLDALEQAVRASVANVRGFDDETRVVIACDVSGSMQRPLSAKSSIMAYDIGLMLGMLLQSKCRNVVAGMFGDVWKTLRLPAASVLQNVQEFYRREGEVGYSTNGHLVVADLLKRRVVVDKVMIFTDCQLWVSNGDQQGIAALWNEYRRRVAPQARLYLFDLAGYGDTPLRVEQNGVYLVAGWSDKVFEVLDALERGGTALEQIDKIEL
jgi:60 kDa SS-A/Ro ribonucleoprotein